MRAKCVMTEGTEHQNALSFEICRGMVWRTWEGQTFVVLHPEALELSVDILNPFQIHKGRTKTLKKTATCRSPRAGRGQVETAKKVLWRTSLRGDAGELLIIKQHLKKAWLWVNQAPLQFWHQTRPRRLIGESYRPQRKLHNLSRHCLQRNGVFMLYLP